MDLRSLSPEQIEQEKHKRAAEIERLRAESMLLQAELDRRVTEKKVAEEAARFKRMSREEQLAILNAIGMTQTIEADPVVVSTSVPG